MTNNSRMTKKLNRILLINDDTQDALAIKKRLSDVEVNIASQAQARFLNAVQLLPYDLIVVDNDANNMQEARGLKTLQDLSDKLQAPILYTSMQPGMVDPVVSASARIVPTFELADFLRSEFGVIVKKEKKLPAQDGNLTLISTYNSVSGYTPGLFANRVLIVGYDREDLARYSAREIIQANAKSILGNFNWRTDRGLIKNIFIYDGVRSRDDQRFVAASLGHDVRMKVNVVACQCDWEKKSRWADSMYVNLWQTICGGENSLGQIADIALGVVRPNVDYANFNIPREIITKPAKKYEL